MLNCLFCAKAGFCFLDMKINRRTVLVAGILFISLLFAICIAFSLIHAFSSNGRGLLAVDAPTTYDGLSYYSEISAYRGEIESFDLLGLLKSYGLLVVLIYSPIVIFPATAQWWPVLLNSIFLLFCSSLLSTIINRVIFVNSCAIASAPAYLYDPRVGKYPFALLAVLPSVVLILLNPYYLGSLLVPSKDILSLVISTSYLYLISNFTMSVRLSDRVPKNSSYVLLSFCCFRTLCE